MASQKDGIGKKIAIGAGALALTAGVVAAGITLSDKKTRNKVAKKARGGMKRVGDVTSRIAEEIPDRYQAVAHQIGKKTTSTTKRVKRRRSKK